MSHRSRFRMPLVLALTGAALTTGVVAADAAPSPATSVARPAKLAVGVEVLRFSSAGRTTTAKGLLTASLTDNLGHTTVVKDMVALTASAGGGGCRVLHLFLNELTLNLLGLNAHLDKVTLDITGDARGGVLGSLFCRLAHARIASTRTATITALNAGVRAHPSHALRLTAYLNPARAAAAPAPAPAGPAPTTCPVLDLVVGPLNLQLLGLVVNLQKVHLNVTATRGQGKLGDLFCMLSDH